LAIWTPGPWDPITKPEEPVAEQPTPEPKRRRLKARPEKLEDSTVSF